MSIQDTVREIEHWPSEHANSEIADNMRRAIRAVAAAERLVAESLTRRARRRTEASRLRGKDRPRVQIYGTNQTIYQPADDARSALWTTIEASVSDLRDAGQPPEKVLVFVKSALRDALRPERTAENTTLPEDVVRWAIEAYFRGA